MKSWVKQITDFFKEKILDRIAERLDLTRRETASLIWLGIFSVAIILLWISQGPGRFSDFSLNLGTEVIGALIIYVLLQIVTSRVNEFGEQRIGFSFSRYLDDVSEAKYQVRVLITYLDILTDDPIYEREKIRYAQILKDLLRENNDFRVSFLILDPWSKAAFQHEDDFPEIKIRLKIKQTLLALYSIQSDLVDANVRNRFDVILYDALPPFILFQIDEKASIFFHPLRDPMRNAERLWFRMHTSFGRFVLHTYDSLAKFHQKTSDLERYFFLTLTVNDTNMKAHYVKEDGENKPVYILANAGEDVEIIEAFKNHKVDTIELLWKGIPCIHTLEECEIPGDDFTLISPKVKEKYGAENYQKLYKSKFISIKEGITAPGIDHPYL